MILSPLHTFVNIRARQSKKVCLVGWSVGWRNPVCGLHARGVRTEDEGVLHIFLYEGSVSAVCSCGRRYRELIDLVFYVSLV